MLTPGTPQDLDDESLRRIARSFYVVRMVRYAALLVSALVFVAACLATDAPVAVTATLVVVVLAFGVAMAATRRRYLSSLRLPAGGPSSSSPTG
jgi:hypothetical protein